MSPIAELSGLSIFAGGRALVQRLDLVLNAGDKLGVFGPSGAGKSTLGKLLSGLLEETAEREFNGSVSVLGTDALSLEGAQSLRGRVLFVPQHSATALPPHITVANLVRIMVRAGIAPKAEQTIRELLPALGFHDVEHVLASQPWSLSGGEKQRIAICLGMLRVPNPSLIILDEPTASLDLAAKSQTIDAVLNFQQRNGFALIVISHDRWLLKRLESRLLRIENGQNEFLDRSNFQFETQAKLGSYKNTHIYGSRSLMYSIEGVGALTNTGNNILHDIRLQISHGERIVITGSSGAGKSTLAKLISGHLRPSIGIVRYRQNDTGLLEKLSRPQRSIQPIYQDAKSSFDPRLTLRRSIELARSRTGICPEVTRINTAAEALGISPDILDRLPSSISGGECQRAALLRALVAEPAVIVADEPTANLDPLSSIALQEALVSMCGENGLTLVAFSHDEHFVSAVASRRIEIEAGKIRSLSC